MVYKISYMIYQIFSNAKKIYGIQDILNVVLNILYIISDIYGKPFYYLLCRIDILYVISDILYRM